MNNTMNAGVADNPFTSPVLVESWHEKQYPDLSFHSNYWHFRRYRQKIGTMEAGQIDDEISVRNPETGESQTAHLIRERIVEDNDSGHIERVRVYSPEFTDIIHGDSVVFSSLDWSGLNSTHSGGGKVYGVSFDSKRMSYYSARKEIASIGKVEDAQSISGSGSVIPPNGILEIEYFEGTIIEVDASLPSDAIRANIQNEGFAVSVSKYSNTLEIQGLGIDAYKTALVRDMVIESPVEFYQTDGYLKIVWPLSSTKVEGILTLAGKAIVPEGFANSNLTGTITFNYSDPSRNFTLTDISDFSQINADLFAGGYEQRSVSYLNNVLYVGSNPAYNWNAVPVGLHLKGIHPDGYIWYGLQSITVNVPDFVGTINAIQARKNLLFETEVDE